MRLNEDHNDTNGWGLTFEFAPDEMTIQLRLTDQELQFPSLAHFTSPDVPLFLLILLPEDEHLTHESLGFGLNVFRALRRLGVRFTGGESTHRG